MFVEIASAFSFESRELSHLITRNMSFLHAAASCGKSTGEKRESPYTSVSNVHYAFVTILFSQHSFTLYRRQPRY